MPAIFTRTIGHEQVKRLLEVEVKEGKLAHAYLFLGPEGVGKRTLARELASYVSADERNVLSYSVAAGSVEELRQFTARLALRPLGEHMQVAIIDGAESMSTAMSNSLLKTLEEPSPKTLIILVSRSRAVPATIISRCRVVLFGSLTKTDLHSVAAAHGMAVSDDVLHLASGSASQLLQLAGQGDAAKEYAQWRHDWTDFLAAPLWKRLSFVSTWADVDESDFRKRLMTWMIALDLDHTDATTRAKRKHVLNDAWTRLAANANKKMILEYICLNV